MGQRRLAEKLVQRYDFFPTWPNLFSNPLYGNALMPAAGVAAGGRGGYRVRWIWYMVLHATLSRLTPEVM